MHTAGVGQRESGRERVKASHKDASDREDTERKRESGREPAGGIDRGF